MARRQGSSASDAAPWTEHTIVFTDICGSTQWVDKLGDQRWLDVLMGHRLIVRRRVEEFGGTEVDTAGDGFMLTFDSLESAVECMAAVQRDMASCAPPLEGPGLDARVGIHQGRSLPTPDGSYAGRDVHVAARVADAARGGEVLLTERSFEGDGQGTDLNLGDVRRASLRGLAEPHALRVVRWDSC